MTTENESSNEESNAEPTGSNAPDPEQQRERFAERLREAGASKVRFIDVHDGAKGSTDHTQCGPDDGRLNGNYGVYGGLGEESDIVENPDPEKNDGVHFDGDPEAIDKRWVVDVDVDDYDDAEDADVPTDGLDSLPKTFTIESPHTDGVTGGHRYYVVRGHVAKAIFDHFGKKNLKPAWGEVRVYNQYCVGPGSQISPGGCVHDWCDRCMGCDKEWCDRCAEPDGGYYRIADDRPIAVLGLDEFVEAIAEDVEASGSSSGGGSGSSAPEPRGRDGENGTADGATADYSPDPSASASDAISENGDIATYLAIGKDDRSSWDWRACKKFIKAGVAEEEAKQTLAENTHTKVGDADYKDYWADTWNNAIESVREEYAERDEAPPWTNVENSDDPAPDVEKPGPGDGFVCRQGGYGVEETKYDDGEPYTTWDEWTNFQLELNAIITTKDDDVLDITVHPRDAASYDVEVETTAFNERRKFRNSVCTGRTATFAGSDWALSRIKQFVGGQDAIEKRGVDLMGYTPSGDEPTWVVPGGELTADGWRDVPENVYLPHGGTHTAMDKVNLSPDVGAEYDREAVAEILRLLPNTREKDRFLPILGWYYATVFRPLIQDWEGEFNIAAVTGGSGAGKTTTLEVLWELFGMDSDPLSVDTTNFVLNTALSSTKSIPMWFDEYKPSELSDKVVDPFKRKIRTTTKGGLDPRGTKEQGTNDYRLTAPAIVSGEERLQGEAEERRGIFTALKKPRDTPEGEVRRENWSRLTGRTYDESDESGQYGGYADYYTDHALASICWVLSQSEDDVKEMWDDGHNHVADLLDNLDVERPDDTAMQGLQTVKFGCTLYRAFADSVGLDPDEAFTTEEVDDALTYLMTDSAGGVNKEVHINSFMSVASLAAKEGWLNEDDHYTFVHKGESRENLRLNLETSTNIVRKFAREFEVSQDILGSPDEYKQRVEDESDDVGWLTHKKQWSPPAGNAIGIDTDIAEEEIANFGRWMWDESTHGARREKWQTLDTDANGRINITVEVTHRDTDTPTDKMVERGTLRDVTKSVDYVVWANDDGSAPVTLDEGQCYAIEGAKLDEYEGAPQIVLNNGVSSVEEVKPGYENIPYESPGRNDTITGGVTTVRVSGDLEQTTAIVHEIIADDGPCTAAHVIGTAISRDVDVDVEPDAVTNAIEKLQTDGRITDYGDGYETV